MYHILFCKYLLFFLQCIDPIFVEKTLNIFYLVILSSYFYRNILISSENCLMIIVYTKFIISWTFYDDTYMLLKRNKFKTVYLFSNIYRFIYYYSSNIYRLLFITLIYDIAWNSNWRNRNKKFCLNDIIIKVNLKLILFIRLFKIKKKFLIF